MNSTLHGRLKTTTTRSTGATWKWTWTASSFRVVGDATANEAADVIKAVSQLRQRHEAFVITNAVRWKAYPVTTPRNPLKASRRLMSSGPSWKNSMNKNRNA